MPQMPSLVIGSVNVGMVKWVGDSELGNGLVFTLHASIPGAPFINMV